MYFTVLTVSFIKLKLTEDNQDTQPFSDKMSFSNICLLCLQNSDGLFEIFGKRGIELNAGAILKVHFWFEVSETDERSVCEKCWWSVHHFHVFYNSVKLNYENQSIFDVKSVVVDSTEHNELPDLLDAIKDEPNIDIKNDLDECSSDIPYSHDVRESYVESERHRVTDHAANHTTNSPTITRRKRQNERSTSVSPSINPKKFKTDSHTLLLSTYFKMACDLCDTLLSSYRDTNKHYKDAHNINKGYLICCSKKFFRLQHMLQHCQWHMNPDSFKCDHCPKAFNDKYRLRDHFNNCHAPENEKVFSCNDCNKIFSKQHYLSAHIRKGHNSQSSTASMEKVRKPRFNFDKEHEMIRSRFLMQCDVCGEPYSIFRDAQLHHLKAHNQAGYLYCCDRKFFKMYRAVQHCIWHNDPESFKCSFCQKCFTDKISLRDHIRNVHSPEAEREFQCEICKKSFAKSYILRSHMKVNHVKDEDKQFECHICGIRFVILPFLKSHINRVHRNVHSHICELCAKPFKSGKSYEMHYVNFHTNISQKVQCDKCGKWLKHKESLKKHILWHNSKTETCGICGRVSSNIRALRAHIRTAHREASLECTICGKMFKKQQVLKEHMAIHAGITDLYTCTFCTKTFRSSANMYSHRKRAHPVELEHKKASLNCFTPATTV